MNKKSYFSFAAILFFLIATFFGVKVLSVPSSDHFSMTNGEKIENFPSIVSSADKSKILAEIEVIPTYENVEEYQKLLAIAQNYIFLGEGKRAYKTLVEAIELKPEKSTAFNMLGNLLVSMKKYKSARNAFEIAVKKEPGIYTNHAALAAFLRDYFSYEKDAIALAYKDGLSATEGHLNLLKDNAAWLEEIKDIKGAIELWQKVYEEGGYDPAVRNKINVLREQL